MPQPPLTTFQIYLAVFKLLAEAAERDLSEHAWLVLKEILVLQFVPDDALASRKAPSPTP